MSISAVCQACQHRFQAPDSFAGKRVKCRHCGVVFQIPELASTDAAGSDEVESAPMEPAAMEASDALADAVRSAQAGRSFGGGGAPRPSASPIANRGWSANDNTDDDADEDDGDDQESKTQRIRGRRPNFPVHSYPGAAMVDSTLPIALIIFGLGWLAVLVSGDLDATNQPIIKFTRFLVPVVMYWAVIFPFVYSMLGKAAAELKYNLPPTPKVRAFSAYLPAFVLSTALWNVGQGSLPGMIVGMTMGLALSSGAIYLLFRLRDTEVATTIGYGAGGFAMGAAATALLILGLNFSTDMAVLKGKGQQSVPVSPYAVGLPWQSKPQAESKTEAPKESPLPVAPANPTVVAHASPRTTTPPPTPTAVTPPTANLSPVLSDVHTVALPGYAGTTTLLRPMSDSPVVGLMKPAVDGSADVVAWNVLTDAQVGVDIHLPAGQSSGAVISDGGGLLAHIVAWPRRSVRFENFATGRNVAKIDLDTRLQDPVLLGFVGPDQLLVRAALPGAPVSDIGSALGVKGGATPVVLVINLYDSSKNQTISIPPVADKGFTIAVCAATNRMAIATQRGGVPVVVQYDVESGLPISTTINLDIDHSMPVAPTGFTYTADGKRIGILFEHEGNAALLSYDANTGQEPAELDFPAPAGIVPLFARTTFKGNALSSPDADAWLAYGQRLIDARSGDVVAPMMVDGVTDQRVVEGGHIELVTAGPTVAIASLDPVKLRKAMHSAAPVNGTSAPPLPVAHP